MSSTALTRADVYVPGFMVCAWPLGMAGHLTLVNALEGNAGAPGKEQGNRAVGNRRARPSQRTCYVLLSTYMFSITDNEA